MSLSGRTYAVLVAEGVEDLEYWVTVMRLREEGATVVSDPTDTTGAPSSRRRITVTLYSRSSTPSATRTA